MDRDELGERLRRAAGAEQIAVDRIVKAALADGAGSSQRASGRRRPEHHVALAVLTVSLVAIGAIGGWWWRQQSRRATAGIYRVEALAAPPPGVYRADAIASPLPARVVSLRVDGETAWIVSTTPDGDGMPPGSAIVVGEGDGR